jgi:YidC/Oxa1 family membrane protein insertase
VLAILDSLAGIFAWPFTQFYALTGSYAVSIMLITVVVMLITTPLTLKSTKGMLEMQRLQPELKRLQAQHRGDRQKLNEEMMKLYQQHKVNPLASCFPLLLQMPVFIGMFQLLQGLTKNTDKQTGFFLPKHIDKSSELYADLSKSKEMLSWGLDLAKSPSRMFEVSAAKGVLYIVIVVFLAFLYWVQQRMVANRTVSPSMSATQQKLMQYLPVAFAVFQIFFPLGLVVYYVWQTVLRIVQQYYVTRRFYHGEGSLGQMAQAAGAEAREISKADKADKSKSTPQAKTEQRPRGGSGSRPTPPKATPKGGKPASGAARAKPAGQRPSAPQRPTKPVKPTKPQKPNKPQS